VDHSADVVAGGVELGSGGSEFVLRVNGAEVPVALPLLGGFNVANALCAAGLALAAGIDLDDVRRGLDGATGVPGRMDRIDLGQQFTVVVDYAHTPESLRRILTLLRALHPAGRLIAVSGSAGERDPTKRPLQGAVCAELADLSIFTSEDPRHEDPNRIIREIADGAVARGGVRGESVIELVDRRAAISTALAAARPGDCVLLAGKGHETSMIWGYEHRPWDEAAVARELLHAGGHTRGTHAG
jgi:UDP-N-acetylmuramoyl-L-alanyl-D-glutamate--2,6-diaminopimelate ligase